MTNEALSVTKSSAAAMADHAMAQTPGSPCKLALTCISLLVLMGSTLLWAATDPSDIRPQATNPLSLEILPEGTAHPGIRTTPASNRDGNNDAVRDGNPLWAVPLSALTATTERPIFSPSRRPPRPAVVNVVTSPTKTAPASNAVLPPRFNLLLIGIIAGGADEIAVFLDRTTQKTVRLRTGEGHLGWILESVSVRSATLKNGTQREVVALPKPGE